MPMVISSIDEYGNETVYIDGALQPPKPFMFCSYVFTEQDQKDFDESIKKYNDQITKQI